MSVTKPSSLSITNISVVISFSVTIMCIIRASRFVFLLCGARENRGFCLSLQNNIGVLLSYFYPEAEEDLIESSVHHKTTLPCSNEQSSAIRPRGQRPCGKRKEQNVFPMQRPSLLIPPFRHLTFPFVVFTFSMIFFSIVTISTVGPVAQSV